MLRLCKGGVYIHVWTGVILRIVESESTPKGEQFQVGGHEQSWLFGPLRLGNSAGSVLSAQTLGVWVELLW